MRIQQLSGGLASQVFQYAFMRYGEINGKDKDSWYLDDTEYFIKDIYNGYELGNVFGVKPKLLSEYFSQDVWERILSDKRVGISMPQIIKNTGEEIAMYAENDSYKEDNPFDGKVYRILPDGECYPQIASLDIPNIYYHGTWVDMCWFSGIRDILMQELKFPEMTNPQDILYRDSIMNNKSVALHIRRGDFVGLGIQLESEFYFDALKDISKQYKDFTVYVFSDDLYWCNQHANEIGLNFAPKIEYISGNVKNGSFIDLQLMSMCEIIIPANSAFSCLAGLMDERLEAFRNPWTGNWMKRDK